MRNSVIAPAVAIFSMFSGMAQGHGIPLDIGYSSNGNKLLSLAFMAYEPLAVGTDSKLTLTATDVRGAAGFYPQFGRFPTGVALTVDASGSPKHPTALAYWDGTNVLPSPVDVRLLRTGIDVTVLKTDTFRAIGTLPAYNGALGGHSALNIRLPVDAPTGLYALGFQVTAPGFTRSETFWGIANYGLTDEQAAIGIEALTLAVPEPSSLVLGAFGVLALGVQGWRRKRAGKN